MKKDSTQSNGVLLSRFDCDIQYFGKAFLKKLWEAERIDLMTADDPLHLFFHDVDKEEIDRMSAHIETFLEGAETKRLALAAGSRPDVLTDEEVRCKVRRAVDHLGNRFSSASVEGLFVDQQTGAVERII